MGFLPNEVRPQRQIDFATYIYGPKHNGFTPTGKNIVKPTSPSESIAANSVEEADGNSTEKQ
ncbi:MAG TPA: hypothetical protein PKJ26_04235 [Candidatus Woesebacteria bacterium]|nr:hypothetical protein [Candidatus Woesebacteria bacterium]HNS65677.1 hypothetical protein [Candidatus Woesebacteria bacterium]